MELLYCEDELEYESPFSASENNPPQVKLGAIASSELPRQYSNLHACQLDSMFKLERRLHSDRLCSEVQPDFTPEHRYFLVQWIHAACYSCDLNLSAFNIAVTLLDRLLAATHVPLCLAQLMTIAIVSIAAKLEGPDMVDDLTRFQVCTDAWYTSYTSEEIADMELEVLISLDWRTRCATAVDFLDQLLAVARVGRDDVGTLYDYELAATVRRRAQRLVLHFLHDSSMVTMRPSSVAAAAIIIGIRDCCKVTAQALDVCLFSDSVDEDELASILEKYHNNTCAYSGPLFDDTEESSVDTVCHPFNDIEESSVDKVCQAKEQMSMRLPLEPRQEHGTLVQPDPPPPPIRTIQADVKEDTETEGDTCESSSSSSSSSPSTDTCYVEHAHDIKASRNSISPTSVTQGDAFS